MVLAKHFQEERRGEGRLRGGVRVDESKGTEVQVQVQTGSCVLFNPHARSAPHTHSWQISYLLNASRQLCQRVQSCH